jgi:hypothetical protein
MIANRPFAFESPMSLSLPDDLYFPVQQAAAPVSECERTQFLTELAAELGRYPVLGPGVVHRCAAELQRRFTVEARAMAVGEEQRQAARFRRGSSDDG